MENGEVNKKKSLLESSTHVVRITFRDILPLRYWGKKGKVGLSFNQRPLCVSGHKKHVPRDDT